MPLVGRSYLNAESFDDAVGKYKVYREQVEANAVEKAKREAEFEDRVELAKENGEDFEEIVREYQETAWPEVAYPDYAHEAKKFALCCDTLGQDREIGPDQIAQVDALCQGFVRSWERVEHSYLMEDVERFIAYEKSVDWEEVVRGFNEAEEKQVAVKMMGAGDLSEEKLDYRSDEVRLQVVREQLLDKEGALRHLLQLNEYRVIKFPRVLQNAFYLAGHSKEEVNVAGRNELNWRALRNLLLTEEFVQKIAQYQFAGAKAEEVPLYAKVNRVLKRVAEISRRA